MALNHLSSKFAWLRSVKKWSIRLAALASIIILLTVVNNYYVERVAEKKLFTNTDLIPARKTGLLLGTVKTLANGQPNLYFQYRIEAAAELYHAGKIEQLIVSGDNSRKDYNEPADMQQALIALGIPAERIHLDYAGFRTLDSVVRADAIFDQKEFTVISQPFHNARAVYIAQRKGMDAIAYNAQEVSWAYGRSVFVREYLARMKMQLDLIFGKKPKFLGPKVIIS